jgi:predicted metal-binding protein
VKRFREKLGMNMFLFQVGARDMMRMSPGADSMCGPCGNKLCCKSNMILPNIEIEAIILQNLEGRDIEKLKGKC